MRHFMLLYVGHFVYDDTVKFGGLERGHCPLKRWSSQQQ